MTNLPASSLVAARLEAFFNNVGVTSGGHPRRGGFGASALSYPAGDLLQQVGSLHGLLDHVDGAGRPDNVLCEGQRIAVRIGFTPKSCVVVGATEKGSYCEPLRFIDSDGLAFDVDLGLSDWFAQCPSFGERCVVRASRVHTPDGEQFGPSPGLWLACLELSLESAPVLVHLPDNPFMHVFALAFADDVGCEEG